MGVNGKIDLSGLPPEIAAAVMAGQKPVVIQQPMNDTQVVILAASQIVHEGFPPSTAVAMAMVIMAEAILQMGPGNAGLQQVVDRIQKEHEAQLVVHG